MTQSIEQIQTNFTAGVADPKLLAREDIVYYYNALQAANNLISLPQGGITRRPGMQRVRKLSPVFTAVDISSATFTAGHGGTASYLYDSDDTVYFTTDDNLGTTNPFIVFSVDLGAAAAITAVDVTNFKLSSSSLTDEFYVQYSTDGSTWVNYGTAMDIDSTDRSRRRRNETGAISAQYWRLVRIGDTDTAATVSVAQFSLWADSATLSAGRLFPFAYSTVQSYMHVLSDGNIDVMTGANYQTSVKINHASADLAVTNCTQSLDTMIVFHTAHAPYRVFRQGSDDEFDWRDQPFTNIPQYDYGAGTGGVDEVQTLNVAGTTSGDTFTLEFEGGKTTSVSVGADDATTAASIQTALRALANVGGDTGLTVAAASPGFAVTFSGDKLGHRPHVAIQVFVLSGNGVWDVAQTTPGQYEGEDIFSSTRGYPRCGTFYQSRLHLGGTLGVPDAWLASVLNDRFNFDTTLDASIQGLQFRAEADQVSAIYQIVPGRELTFFTSDMEFYDPQPTVNVNSVMKIGTRKGIKEGLRVYEVDEVLVFVQGILDDNGDQVGTSIRQFVYDELTQNYKSNLLSKFSGSLIKNPVDAALRKALSADEADILLLPNEDGTATSFTLMLEDDVRAFMPISVRAGDSLLAVGVDKRQRVYWITERIINGTAARFVEMWNADLLLDCGTIITITAEEYTAASDGQDTYTWTFDSPSEAAAIGVRLNGGRLAATDYRVDLSGKTVTLSSTIAATIVKGDKLRLADMIKTVTDADDLEGETLQTVVDGSEGDDVTVSSGSFTLSDYADTQIQYGYDFDVSCTLMPFRVAGAPTTTGHQLRVVNAYFNLFETGNLEILANDGDWQNVPLQQTDTDVLDKSEAELLFTGTKKVDGLLGYSLDGVLQFRQPGPAPFTLLSVTREVHF